MDLLINPTQINEMSNELLGIKPPIHTMRGLIHVYVSLQQGGLKLF